jgi:hypothetical protein
MNKLMHGVRGIIFLIKLIQNAKDNEYLVGMRPTLEFVLTSADITRIGVQVTLLVFNNEVGFSKNQH